MKPVTVATLRELKQAGEPITCLTCYEASFARLMEEVGVEVLLVGDSLGMVVQGEDTTLAVRLADIIYHSRCVRRGSSRPMLVADMPFMSYSTPLQALGNAGRLLAEGGAHVVKLEGGRWLAETVTLLTARGIPVCAHLGLLPQSIFKVGGYRVQGRDAASAETMLEDALALEAAGACMMVLECVPQDLAARITAALSIPVIGIGAGPRCDGQVLVLHDLLGISSRRLRFSRNFLGDCGDIRAAVADYVAAVKTRRFPGPENSYD